MTEALKFYKFYRVLYHASTCFSCKNKLRLLSKTSNDDPLSQILFKHATTLILKLSPRNWQHKVMKPQTLDSVVKQSALIHQCGNLTSYWSAVCLEEWKQKICYGVFNYSPLFCNSQRYTVNIRRPTESNFSLFFTIYLHCRKTALECWLSSNLSTVPLGWKQHSLKCWTIESYSGVTTTCYGWAVSNHERT